MHYAHCAFKALCHFSLLMPQNSHCARFGNRIFLLHKVWGCSQFAYRWRTGNHYLYIMYKVAFTPALFSSAERNQLDSRRPERVGLRFDTCYVSIQELHPARATFVAWLVPQGCPNAKTPSNVADECSLHLSYLKTAPEGSFVAMVREWGEDGWGASGRRFHHPPIRHEMRWRQLMTNDSVIKFRWVPNFLACADRVGQFLGNLQPLNWHVASVAFIWHFLCWWPEERFVYYGSRNEWQGTNVKLWQT